MRLLITTALGKSIRCNSVFVGSDLDKLVYIRTPDISPHDQRYFLNEGYWVQVTTVSKIGEGARLSFKCKIAQHIPSLKLLAVEIPYVVNLSPLRSEARFKTIIKGLVLVSDKKVPMVLRDLSQHGCGVHVSFKDNSLENGADVQLKLLNDKTKEVFGLSGHVQNIAKDPTNYHIGIKFDEQSESTAKDLLSHLMFNGTELVFPDE
uniref:PilZ domain-containing protein n=1 Tax=Thaumasiovibrio occultus TaxID=1891184 RepID=UPI00131B1E95|nr:PilZ domain-containing protein [Thaumasiovibrio occultus]